MGTMRPCDTCRKPFVDDEGWKRKCLICWKTEAKYELTKSDKSFAALQDWAVMRESELQALKAELEKTKVEYNTYRASSSSRRLKATLPPERIMQLIRLSHPDKHGNSDLANEVTKWLLALREASKEK